MKKAFVISCRVPAVDLKGDQIAAYRRIIALKEAGFEVHSIFPKLCFSKQNLSALEELAKIGVNLKIIQIGFIELFHSLLRVAFFSSEPIQNALYTSKMLRQTVGKELQREKPNVVLCITSRAAALLDNVDRKFSIDFVDSIALNFARRQTTKNYLLRILYKIEESRLIVWEKMIAQKAKCSFIVSSIDKAHLGARNVTVTPLGIYKTVKTSNYHNKKNIIVFSGNMSYQPNVEAAVWFTKHCWQSIFLKFPHYQFHIVGRSPNETVRKLQNESEGVIVVGEVENLQRYISQSKVAVAPMFSGSGMQLKILEAMNCGVPTVTTSMGLGDIAAQHKKEIIIQNNKDAFISSICEILTDMKLAQKLSRAGKRFISTHHNGGELDKTFIRQLKC